MGSAKQQDHPTLLNDRYRLTEHIGVGGSADVWRATDELLNREVAVKVLREVADPTQRARFIEEAQTLASFNHPGLVVVLDAGILDERPFLVMTLADDATLASRIEKGPVESSVVKSIGAQIALALGYAHERGVVHRDVKPANVLLCGDGRAVLSDFGIARLMGSTAHHTRTGDAIGSPAYLAPEQVAGEELTPAVDIYSLGLVLLEALTAERAFPGSPIEAAMARLNAAPPIPPTVDPEWEALLTRMTNRMPANRPTAQEVADELARSEFPEAVRSMQIPAYDLDPEATGPLPVVDPEATGKMSILDADAADTMDSLGFSDEVDDPPVRRRRWLRVVVGLAVVALAIAAFLILVRTPNGVSTTHAPATPTNVPAKYRPALSHLHDAVNGPAR